MSIRDITNRLEASGKDLDGFRDGADAMSQPLALDGSPSASYVKGLSGADAEKFGYVAARDEGPAKEFVKGARRGIEQLQSSVGKTFGAEEFSARKDYFLATNRQLFDSDRKGTMSYIANTGGAAIAQNAPNFAAMLALGGFGAPAWALRGSLMAGSYIQVYGENREELDRHVGDDMSPMAKTWLASGQSVVDSILEMGLGAEKQAVKAVSRMVMAKTLAKAGGLQEAERQGARMFGVLGRAVRSTPLKSGAGEVGDSFFQNLHKDVVNLSLNEEATGQDVLNRLAEYPRELRDAFVGGVAVGLIPGTINAMTNYRVSSQIKRLAAEDKRAEEALDTAVTQDERRITYIDEDAKARTNQAFADLGDAVGSKPVATVMRTIAYNMAYAARQADPKSTVRPEAYIGDLKTLFVDKGVDIKRVEELAGNSEELLKYLSEHDEGFFNKLTDMRDSLESFDLNRQLEPVRRDIGMKAPPLTDAEREEFGAAIAKRTGGAKIDRLFAADVKNFLPKEVLRRAYVSRVLSGVKIGSTKYDVLLNDDLSARLFPEGALTVTQMGGTKLSQRLAELRRESVNIGRSLQRIKEFDRAYSGATPPALLTDKAGRKFTATAQGLIDESAGVNPYFAANAPLENIWTDAKAGNAQAIDALKFLNIKKRGDLDRLQQERVNRVKEPTLREMAEEEWARQSEEERVKVWGEEPYTQQLLRLAAEAVRVKGTEESPTSELLRLAQESQTGGPLFSRQPNAELGQMRGDAELLLGGKAILSRSQQVQSPSGLTTAWFAANENAQITALPDGRILGIRADNQNSTRGKRLWIVEESVRDSDSGKITTTILHNSVPSKAEAARAMLSRQLAAWRGDSSTLPSKTGEGQIVGQYLRDQKLAIFYAGSDASTIMHEWFHHITENKLLPGPMQDILTEAFSVTVGDERRWTAASAENAASAFLQYIRDGDIPEAEGLTDAFRYIKGVLSAHWKELNQVVTVDGDLSDTGAELDFGKYEKVRKLFDAAFAEAAADAEQIVYGGALTSSMLASDVANPVHVSDASLRATAGKAAAKLGDVEVDAYVNKMLIENPDLFNGNGRMQDLNAEERALAQLFFEEQAGSEATGPVVDDQPRVLFQRKGGNQRADLNRMVHRSFGGDHAAASDYAKSQFGVSSMADLSVDQLRQMVTDKGGIPDPDVDRTADQLAKAIISSGSGIKVGTEDWGNPLHWFVKSVQKRVIEGGEYITSVLMDWNGMWQYIGENDQSSVIGDMRRKHSVMWNDFARKRNAFYTQLLTEMDKAGLDQDFRMGLNGHKVNIGGLALTPSQALDLWLKSDFGKNLKRSDIKLTQEASPEYTDDVIRSAIEYVEKTDPKLATLGRMMQSYNMRVFREAAKVYEAVTGNKLQPVKGAYTPLLYKDGSPHQSSEDYLRFLESVTGEQQQPNRPGKPSALVSRTGEAGAGSLLDAWGNFNRHADTLMNYAVKAEGIKEIVQVLNDKRVVDAFALKYGSQRYRNTLLAIARREMSVGAMLKRLSGEPGGPFGRWLMTNAYHAFLPYNPFTVLTQTISLANGLSTMPAKESVTLGKNFLSTALAMRFGITRGQKVYDDPLFKFVESRSPYVTETFKNPIREQLAESLTNKGIDALGFGKWRFGVFKDKGLHFMYHMDIIVRLSVYKTAFDSKIRELKAKGLSDEQAERGAIQYAEDAVRLSQNPSSSYEKGTWQSEAPEILKLFTPFSSQPYANLRYQTLNIILPTMKAWQKNGLKGVLSASVANPQWLYKVGLGTIAPAIMLGMIARRRPQESLEELLNDIKFSLVLNIPFVGQAAWASAALGWNDPETGGLLGGLLGGVSQSIGELISGEADFSTLPNARRTLELLTGVPDWPLKFAGNLTNKVFIEGGEWNGRTLADITGILPRD